MGGSRIGIRLGARVYARRISFGHVEAMRWFQASVYVPWVGGCSQAWRRGEDWRRRRFLACSSCVQSGDAADGWDGGLGRW
jgi:hypothetical protein